MITTRRDYWTNLFAAAAILLGSIKTPYEEIKRRIVEVDEEKLPPAVLEQLVKYLPPPDTMGALAELKDQYNELAEAEQFAVVVSSDHLHATGSSF